MRAAAALLLFGLVLVAAVLASAGWRHGRAAAGPILAGAAVAFAAFMWVDCRQCAAGALYVGALVSLPFFVVGWVALLGDPAGLSPGGAATVRLAAWGTLAWAALITVTATVNGACPCRAFGWGDPVTPLRAVGTDRLVGPVLVAAALLTLALAQLAIRRHARRRVSARS